MRVPENCFFISEYINTKPFETGYIYRKSRRYYTTLYYIHIILYILINITVTYKISYITYIYIYLT